MNNITEITELVVDLVKSQLNEAVTLTAIEQTTRNVLQEIGRQTIEMSLKTMNHPYPDRRIECECGAEATYIRQRNARLHTIFGKLNVTRAYYLCSACHHGSCPLDTELGLRPNRLSAELSRLVAMTGVQLPFGTGRNLFEALTLVSVSDQAMAKATQRVGELVTMEEEVSQEKAKDGAFLLQKEQEGGHPVRLSIPSPHI